MRPASRLTINICHTISAGDILYLYAFDILYNSICLAAPDLARAVLHVVDGSVVVGARVGAAGVERRAEAVVDVRCGMSIGSVITRSAS